MVAALTALVIAATAAPPAPTAAVWHDHVLVADGAGAVRAWKLDLAPDDALSAALSCARPLAIAAGTSLHGFDGIHALVWNEKSSKWDAGRATTQAEWLAFAVVADAPVLVRPVGVERLTDGKIFPAPKLHESQVNMEQLNAVKVVQAARSTLAIGTSYGGWGGHFLTLDLQTGAWHHFHDPLGDVTGIAWTGEAWAVAWSMNHFSSSTHVRLHRADASVLKDSPRIDRKYLRALTWNGKLQGIEQDELVDIGDDLSIQPRAPLGKIPYAKEPNAIASLLRVDAERVLAVPLDGQPILAGPHGATPLARRAEPLIPLPPEEGR